MQLLKITDKDFTPQFKALVNNRREATVDVSGTVHDILADVKVRGDAAVKDYTSRFDHFSPHSLRLSETFMAEQAAKCPAEVKAALELAAERIASFHQKQLPQDIGYTDTVGGKTRFKLVFPVTSRYLRPRRTR
jgi:histidinol dehydrogenase